MLCSRPWLCYWILHSLALLGEPLDAELEDSVIDFLSRCQVPMALILLEHCLMPVISMVIFPVELTAVCLHCRFEGLTSSGHLRANLKLDDYFRIPFCSFPLLSMLNCISSLGNALTLSYRHVDGFALFLPVGPKWWIWGWSWAGTYYSPNV